MISSINTSTKQSNNNQSKVINPMLKSRCQELAEQHNLGKIHFQSNISPSGKIFNVGYILDKYGKKELFCKAKYNHPDCFFLCNEFESLSPEESKQSRL